MSRSKKAARRYREERRRREVLEALRTASQRTWRMFTRAGDGSGAFMANPDRHWLMMSFLLIQTCSVLERSDRAASRKDLAVDAFHRACSVLSSADALMRDGDDRKAVRQ